jgi:hypothetical protein
VPHPLGGKRNSVVTHLMPRAGRLAVAGAGYGQVVVVAVANRRRVWNAPRWIGVNLARFVGTWAVVGGVFAAAIMLSEGEGDGFVAPDTVGEILSVPFVIVAFVFLAIFSAIVGLVLLGAGVVPGLALYLLAVWWSARTVPLRWRRAAALALSPLIPLLFLVGSDDWVIQLAMLAGSAVYAFVVKLPSGHFRQSGVIATL